MKTNSDSWFTIGKPHIVAGSPCEDYAFSGEIPGVGSFGIVSDGCSGAYANTDIGARTWTHSAKRKVISQGSFSGPDLAEDVRNRNITDDIMDLAATLMVMTADSSATSIRVWGDGCVFAETTSGQEILWECVWDNETPFYLQYLLNQAWMDSFYKCHSNKKTPFVVKKTTKMDGAFGIQEDFFEIEPGIQGWELKLSTEDLKKIAIFSDGITRIDGYSTFDAAKECTNFKNTSGSFLKRRMIRFQQDCQRNGQVFKDDLSVAAIVFGDE